MSRDMKQFAEINITFWPIVFENSPDTVICPIVGECNNVPGIPDTYTCDKYGDGSEYFKIEKTDSNLLRIFEKPVWKA